MGGLFGGGGSPKVVEVPVVEEVPMEEAQEPEAKAVRDDERRKLRARRGMGGTILTSAQGALGTVGATGAGLLGQAGTGRQA